MFQFVKRPAFHTLTKALDISSVTVRVAPDLQKTKAVYQVQLSEDLQLIEKTLNHTGNQKRGNISDRNIMQFRLFLERKTVKKHLSHEERLYLMLKTKPQSY